MERPAPPDLPALPTMGVGAYAAPGWFGHVWRAARKGELGPHDIEELLDDATRIAVADQIDAGLDVLSDGELRRQRFVYEMFDRMTGLERVPPRRRLGITGYDMTPHYVARGSIAAPDGFGTVADYRAALDAAGDRPLKVAIPGPLTFAMNIDPGDNSLSAVLAEVVTAVNVELKALAAAGVPFVQLDEPGLPAAPHGLSLADAAELINRAANGVAAHLTVHVCFGNNAGRPMADRRFAPLLKAIEALRCDRLMLEFANREMAETELLAHLGTRFEIAAGVIDVKNFKVESADEVARRIERCVEACPIDKLAVTADCGFSALPRYIARAKMQAMVGGAALVRGRL